MLILTLLYMYLARYHTRTALERAFENRHPRPVRTSGADADRHGLESERARRARPRVRAACGGKRARQELSDAMRIVAGGVRIETHSRVKVISASRHCPLQPSPVFAFAFGRAASSSHAHVAYAHVHAHAKLCLFPFRCHGNPSPHTGLKRFIYVECRL